MAITDEEIGNFLSAGAPKPTSGNEVIKDLSQAQLADYFAGKPLPKSGPGFLSDIGNKLVSGTGTGISSLGWLAGLKGAEDYGNEMAQGAEMAMSPLGIERSQREIFPTAAPGEGIMGLGFNPAGLAKIPYAIAESTPGMVAGMVGAAGAAAVLPEAAVVGVGSLALRSLGPLAGRVAASSLGEAGLATAANSGVNILQAAAPLIGKRLTQTGLLSTIEGAQAAAMNGQRTEQEAITYLTANPNRLQETEIGRVSLQESNGDIEAAIKLTAARLGMEAAYKVGPSTALLALPGSALQTRILNRLNSKGMLKEAGIGAFGEGIQEGPQSAAESFLSGSVMGQIDPSQTPTLQTVARAGLEGALIGAPMGGGLGLIGSAISPAEQTASDVDRQAQQELFGRLQTFVAGRDFYEPQFSEAPIIETKAGYQISVPTLLAYADTITDTSDPIYAINKQTADPGERASLLAEIMHPSQIQEAKKMGDQARAAEQAAADQAEAERSDARSEEMRQRSQEIEEDNATRQAAGQEELLAGAAATRPTSAPEGSTEELVNTARDFRQNLGPTSYQDYLDAYTSLTDSLIKEQPPGERFSKQVLQQRAEEMSLFPITNNDVESVLEQYSTEVEDPSISVASKPLFKAPDGTYYKRGEVPGTPGPEYARRRRRRPAAAPAVDMSDVMPEIAAEPTPPAVSEEEYNNVRLSLNNEIARIAAAGRGGERAADAVRRALRNKNFNAPQLLAAINIAKDQSRILGGISSARPVTQFIENLTDDSGAGAQGVRYGRTKNSVAGLIQYSLAPDQISFSNQTGVHEALHVVQSLLKAYDPNTYRIVANDFTGENGTGITVSQIPKDIQRKLKLMSPERGGKISYWDMLNGEFGANAPEGNQNAFAEHPDESMAYTFAMLDDARRRGYKMGGLKPAYLRLLNLFSEIQKSVQRMLGGARTADEILNRISTGTLEAPGVPGRRFGAEQPRRSARRNAEFSSRQGAIEPSLEGSSPERTAWEKKGVIRGEDGNPLRVYTGTTSDNIFDTFNVEGSGVWFTTDIEAANSHADTWISRRNGNSYNAEVDGEYQRINDTPRVIPAYVRMQKPLVLTDDQWSDVVREYDSSFGEAIKVPKIAKALEDWNERTGEDWHDWDMGGPIRRAGQAYVFDKFRKDGYDGIQVPEIGLYVILGESNQIKSPFNTFPEGAAEDKRFSKRYSSKATNQDVVDYYIDNRTYGTPFTYKDFWNKTKGMGIGKPEFKLLMEKHVKKGAASLQSGGVYTLNFPTTPTAKPSTSTAKSNNPPPISVNDAQVNDVMIGIFKHVPVGDTIDMKSLASKLGMSKAVVESAVEEIYKAGVVPLYASAYGAGTGYTHSDVFSDYATLYDLINFYGKGKSLNFSNFYYAANGNPGDAEFEAIAGEMVKNGFLEKVSGDTYKILKDAKYGTSAAQTQADSITQEDIDHAKDTINTEFLIGNPVDVNMLANVMEQDYGSKYTLDFVKDILDKMYVADDSFFYKKGKDFIYDGYTYSDMDILKQVMIEKGSKGYDLTYASFYIKAAGDVNIEDFHLLADKLVKDGLIEKVSGKEKYKILNNVVSSNEPEKDQIAAVNMEMKGMYMGGDTVNANDLSKLMQTMWGPSYTPELVQKSLDKIYADPKKGGLLSNNGALIFDLTKKSDAEVFEVIFNNQVVDHITPGNLVSKSGYSPNVDDFNKLAKPYVDSGDLVKMGAVYDKTAKAKYAAGVAATKVAFPAPKPNPASNGLSPMTDPQKGYYASIVNDLQVQPSGGLVNYKNNDPDLDVAVDHAVANGLLYLKKDGTMVKSKNAQLPEVFVPYEPLEPQAPLTDAEIKKLQKKAPNISLVGFRWLEGKGINIREFADWFEDSDKVDAEGKPIPWYRGTASKPSPVMNNAKTYGGEPAIFASPEPWFASDWVSHKGDHARMQPVFLRAAKTWDYQNPKHVAMIVADKDFNGSKSYLEGGSWSTIEDHAFIIRRLGFDSYNMRETGSKNIAVFEQQQMKSIFNQFKPGAGKDPAFSKRKALQLPAGMSEKDYVYGRMADTTTDAFLKFFKDSWASDRSPRTIVRMVNGQRQQISAPAPRTVYHSGSYDETMGMIPMEGKGNFPKDGMHFGSRQSADERSLGKLVDEMALLVTAYKENGLWHWTDGQGTTSQDLGRTGWRTKENAIDSGRNLVVQEFANNYDPSMDFGSAPPLTAAYLSIQNPKTVRDQGFDWTAEIAKAKAEGYDSIVYRNLFEDIGSESYIAFYPEQIKSIYNAGSFDPTVKDIRFSKRGARKPKGLLDEDYVYGRMADVTTKAFERFFEGSEVTSGDVMTITRMINGKRVKVEMPAPLALYHNGTYDEQRGMIPMKGKGPYRKTGMHFGTKQSAEDRVPIDYGNKKHREEVGMKLASVFADQYQLPNGDFAWENNADALTEQTNLTPKQREGFKGFETEEEAIEAGRKYVERYYAAGNYVQTAVYLSIKNPKRVQDQGLDWEKEIKKAKAEGYDGIFYYNLYEDYGSISWIAFSPNQIKSVYNTGAFDPNVEDIRLSSRQVNPASRAIMDAWEAEKKAARAAGREPPKRPWGNQQYGTGVWADPPNLGPRPRGRNMPGTPYGGRSGMSGKFSTRQGSIEPLTEFSPQGAQLARRTSAQDYEDSQEQGASFYQRMKNAASKIFHPLGGMTKQDEKLNYLTERYLALGKIDLSEKDATKTYEALRKLPKNEADMVFKYLTTRNAVAPTLSIPGAREAAIKAKTTISEYGDRLVGARILSPQAVAEYKGEYLPRMYMKYLLEEKGMISSGIKMDLAYVNKRQNLSAEERLALGEVKDPGFLAFMALYRPSRDLAVMSFLKNILSVSRDKGYDWFLEDNLVEWRGATVTSHWMASEADAIDERADYFINDPAKKKAMNDLATEMRRLAAPGMKARVPQDYKVIPDTNRYGSLRGMIARKEVYDDIVGTGGVMNADNWWDRTFGDTNSSLSKATAFWKMTKTTMNPPTQVRNFVTNAVVMDISGVNTFKIPFLLGQAAKEISTNGAYFQIAQKYGITASGFSQVELREANQIMQDMLSRSEGGAFNVPHMLKTVGTWTVQTAGDIYAFSEILFKTAKLIDNLQKGMKENEAAIDAHDWFFDYSLVHPSIRRIRSVPFGMPFITYYYKILPKLAETLINHPMRFAKYAALAFAIPAIFAAHNDVDDEEFEALRDTLSERIRKKQNLWAIPDKDENGNWNFLDVGYMLPWSMFQDIITSLSGGDVGAATQSFGLLGSPALSVAAAIKTNIDPFTGKKIWDDSDTPKERAKSLMNYTISVIAPPFLTGTGFLGKLIDKSEGTGLNKYGEPVDTNIQLAGRLLGFNIYSLNPQMQRMRNISYMERDIREIEIRRTYTGRDKSLTPEKRRERMTELSDYIKEKRLELQKYRQDTQIPEALRAGKE